MIERFGLASTPFTKELNPKEHYQVPFIEDEIRALKETIEARMSGLLLAPAGAGKTSILRAVRDALPQARYEVNYIKVTALSKRDMCREVAKAVGAKSASTYPSLVRSVQARFEEGFSEACMRPVLFIDEAHDMRPDVLSMLRILSNFDMDSKLVVSIILAGQPPLKTKLFGPGLEDIRQRLIHCGELRLLSRDETTKYLHHRINIAGGRTFPFDERACEAIFEIARGNMRAIDHIALNALKLAAAAGVAGAPHNHIAWARKKLWI